MSLSRLVVDELYQEESPSTNSKPQWWESGRWRFIRTLDHARSLTSTPRLRNPCNLSCIWREEQKWYMRLCLYSKVPSPQQ